MLTKAPIENSGLADEERATPTPPPDPQQRSSPDDVGRMIAVAAYYIAQRRGFDPGHEVDDWLQAEAEVFDRLAQTTG